MLIYIHKNNQSLGPYEDKMVLEWLDSGRLSPNDLAVKAGESQWRPLSQLFPNRQPRQSNTPPPVANYNQPVTPPAQKTILAYQTPTPVYQNPTPAYQTPVKKNNSSMKIAAVLVGLVIFIFIGAVGILAFYFIGKSKPVVVNVNSSSNSSNTNSVNTNTNTRRTDLTGMNNKLKDFAKLKPPVQTDKNPTLRGKIYIAEQSDRSSEYTLRALSGSEGMKYGISSEQMAVNPEEVDTIIQVNCGKGKEIGKYGPRMAYVPAYSNVCNVSIIDYRASKTIAQKSFVNGKKPKTIYVKDDENEYVLEAPTADVESYLKGLSKS